MKQDRFLKLSGMSAVVLLLFFGLMEVLSALFGVLPLSRRADPFLGFSKASHLFVEDRGNVTIDPRHGAFRKVEFVRPKPKETFRAFVFGESTVWGWPMGDKQAFPYWIERGLQALYPNRKIEVHNLGAGSYASFRMRQIAQEAAGHEPDLFIVYAGNNEFLEKRFFRSIKKRATSSEEVRSVLRYSRTYALLYDLILPLRKEASPEDPFLINPLDNRVSQDPEGFASQAERKEIIDFFGQNMEAIRKMAHEAGAKSLFCTLPINLVWTGPTRSNSVGKNPLYDQAFQDESNGDYTNAARLYETLISNQPNSAELWYRLGRCRYYLNDFSGAKAALLASLEFDLYPQRVLPEMNELVRGMKDILLCDLEEIFDARSPSHLIEEAFFIDTMHPSVSGHKQIAQEIAKVICKEGLLAENRWNEEQFQNAIAVEEEEPTGKLYAQKLYFIGKTHFRQGEFEKAIENFQKAIQVFPGYAPFHDLLGATYGRLGRYSEALKEFQEAVRLDPDNVYGLLNFAIALRQNGQHTEAITALRRAIQIKPDFSSAHFELAKTLFINGDLKGAETAVREALRLSPENPEIQALLGEIQKLVLSKP